LSEDRPRPTEEDDEEEEEEEEREGKFAREKDHRASGALAKMSQELGTNATKS
jgi:hypothetical protein